MSLGLVGVKRGMSRVFSEDGNSIPVTVIEIIPNFISRIKRKDSDGYDAIQVAWGSQLPGRLSQATKGEYKKAGLEAGRGFKEFRLEESEFNGLEPGKKIDLNIFSEGQLLDATGVSIGKGFAGTVKRHNFKTQDATHGNSLSHRVAGSIGQCQTPGRVFKGKKMAGQMGNKKRTVQGLEVVKIDNDNSLLLLKGSTPGSKGASLFLRHSVKAKVEGSS